MYLRHTCTYSVNLLLEEYVNCTVDRSIRATNSVIVVVSCEDENRVVGKYGTRVETNSKLHCGATQASLGEMKT